MHVEGVEESIKAFVGGRDGRLELRTGIGENSSGRQIGKGREAKNKQLIFDVAEKRGQWRDMKGLGQPDQAERAWPR